MFILEDNNILNEKIKYIAEDGHATITVFMKLDGSELTFRLRENNTEMKILPIKISHPYMLDGINFQIENRDSNINLEKDLKEFIDIIENWICISRDLYSIKYNDFELLAKSTANELNIEETPENIMEIQNNILDSIIEDLGNRPETAGLISLWKANQKMMDL